MRIRSTVVLAGLAGKVTITVGTPLRGARTARARAAAIGLLGSAAD